MNARILVLLAAATPLGCSDPATADISDPKVIDDVEDTGDLVANDTGRPHDTARPLDTSTPIDTSRPKDTGWDPLGDSDGDGIDDTTEGRDDAGSRDTDGDGIPDYLDDDSDDDDIADSVEGNIDTDGDGTADYLDEDSDADSLSDLEEGTDDWDGDGVANWRDALNDASLGAIRFIAITTDFNSPIGIDFHESAFDVVTSVYYSSGSPYALETVAIDGSHAQFSSLAGVTDEVKIATVRSGGTGGFTTGDLYVGNGTDGQVVQVSADGSSVTNPWCDLPGDNNGLMRGSLYIDRTDVFSGNLIVATTDGEVWMIDSSGAPTMLADLPGVHLEGLVTVPDAPARYGPIAGTILAGSENEGVIYTIAPDGIVNSFDVGVSVEDIDIVMPHENFFGINYGTSSMLGVISDEFLPIAGDILLTQESVSNVGLFRLYYDGRDLLAEELTATADSATIGQWEHVTFAPAGIQEVPPD